MTDLVRVARPGAGVAPAEDGTEVVDPGQRGRTVLADKVVSSIATIAAGEVEAVVDTHTRRARLVGRGLPRASAVVRNAESRIAVEVASVWPLPLSRVAQQVRGHVHDVVSGLTGMPVAAVDVTVADMVEPVVAPRVQ